MNMNSALLPVSVLTASSSSAAAGGGGLFMMIIYMVIIFGAMYFFAIRPQKKEQKRLQTMISQMEVGDTVVTTSGFYGIVIAVDEEDCIVEFGNNKNCRIPMRKSAIAEIEKASDSAPAPSEQEKTSESAAPKKTAVKGPRAAAREAKEAMKQARIQEKEKAVEENKAAREAKEEKKEQQ
jgi:preprotein translocase subunit YajC